MISDFGKKLVGKSAVALGLYRVK